MIVVGTFDRLGAVDVELEVIEHAEVIEQAEVELEVRHDDAMRIRALHEPDLQIELGRTGVLELEIRRLELRGATRISDRRR